MTEIRKLISEVRESALKVEHESNEDGFKEVQQPDVWALSNTAEELSQKAQESGSPSDHAKAEAAHKQALAEHSRVAQEKMNGGDFPGSNLHWNAVRHHQQRIQMHKNM